MRIIFIRNAETTADDTKNGSEDERNTVVDPEITTKGKEDCVKLGNFLKENGFKINKCKGIYKISFL